MKITFYTIDPELPRAMSLSWRWLWLPAGLLLAAAAAHADLPVTFADGNALTAAQLNSNFEYLESEIAAIQAGSPLCPAGYAPGATPAPPNFTNESVSVCTSSSTGDQVVRVGSGPSAFWIDRYEATVWTLPSGGSLVPDNENAAYLGYVQNNGQPSGNGGVLAPLYALSLPGHAPSRALTWFQAVEFCAASGKQLPSEDQWLRAARGTPDPASNDGTANEACNTFSTSGPRSTSHAVGTDRGSSCVSDWGAEDMIGNLGEWTAAWYAGLNDGTGSGTGNGSWPNPPNSNYNGDGTWNVISYAYTSSAAATWSPNVPAASVRGGDWTNGVAAGIFAYSVANAPSNQDSHVGFRCAILGTR